MANAGRYHLAAQVYRSDRDGRLGEEITDRVIGGEVTVDVNAEVPMTFSAQVTDPTVVPAFGWVRPFLTLRWWDVATGADASLREPVGCFQVMPVGARHTAAMGLGVLDGRDGCWLLKEGALAVGKTWAPGANVIDAVVTLLGENGFTRVRIPARSTTFRTKTHYPAGTGTLEVVNELLLRAGYYPLWFDRAGVATSRKIVPLWKREPRRTIASANGDVVGLIEIETDPERLCNRATCVVNDPDREDPISVTRSNNRASSPVSIQNLGFVKATTVEGGNVESEADALDLVAQALEEGASVATRVALATLPDPAFELRESLALNVDRDDGTAVLSGWWWWDQLRLGFTPAQQPMTWRLNKLVPWTDEE